MIHVLVRPCRCLQPARLATCVPQPRLGEGLCSGRTAQLRTEAAPGGGGCKTRPCRCLDWCEQLKSVPGWSTLQYSNMKGSTMARLPVDAADVLFQRLTFVSRRRDAQFDCCSLPGHFFGRDFLRQYENCTVPGTSLDIKCHWTDPGTQLRDGNVTSNVDTADVLG